VSASSSERHCKDGREAALVALNIALGWTANGSCSYANAAMQVFAGALELYKLEMEDEL
jgi:hypothetical protein